jgi:hypothetical protein
MRRHGEVVGHLQTELSEEWVVPIGGDVEGRLTGDHAWAEGRAMTWEQPAPAPCEMRNEAV